MLNKLVRLTLILSFSIVLPVSVTAKTLNLHDIPQNDTVNLVPYEDWSRAERWSLSRELADIVSYRRMTKAWCKAQSNRYDIFTNALFYGDAHVSYLAPANDPMRMVPDTWCSELSQTYAMKKRDKALSKFERSLVLKPALVELGTADAIDANARLLDKQ